MADTKTKKYSRMDFVSNQAVRWCPGCGDYAILSQTQKVFPDLNIDKEKIVFISGIGCSSRFPYYMNTFGFHTIHGFWVHPFLFLPPTKSSCPQETSCPLPPT